MSTPREPIVLVVTFSVNIPLERDTDEEKLVEDYRSSIEALLSAPLELYQSGDRVYNWVESLDIVNTLE